MKGKRRTFVVVLSLVAVVLAVVSISLVELMIKMPGISHFGPIPPLNSVELALRDLLHKDLELLAGKIGERNMTRYENLRAAANFLSASFESAGYQVRRQQFTVGGKPCDNLEVEVRGTNRAEELVIVGSHYDSVEGCPGANDNGTGAVATLALARFFAGKRMLRTVRFVEWVNEEPPYFQTASMGSWVYAKACRARGEKVVAMLSLETIGYYSDREGSQSYPFPFDFFYPSTGNFITFVGNVRSRRLVRDVVSSFRKHARFPSQGGAVPASVPGVGWSDHWAFWREGYPGVMVTDTAPFRYPYYHTAEDTPDKIHYDNMARVVSGLEEVIADLAGGVQSQSR